jgi:hypothetical protein
VSKEYNERWTKPLVNPPVTLEEYEANRSKFSPEEIGELIKVSQEEYKRKANFKEDL